MEMGTKTVKLVTSESSNGKLIITQKESKIVMNLQIEKEKSNEVYTFKQKGAAEASEANDKEPAKDKSTKQNRHVHTYPTKSNSEKQPYKCQICERCFKLEITLQNHLNIHYGPKPYVCKSCDSSFSAPSTLNRHIRYCHTHEKPHKCNNCNYTAVELHKLKRHERCHTMERPYQCSDCTYAGQDMFHLKRHIRTHTGEKPYKCEICSMCFTQANSLKSHKLIHNKAERPVFPCKLCPAKCSRKVELRIHVQKFHTSNKPLKCKRCWKTFPDLYLFKMHNKTHKGEKDFKCDVCSYISTKQGYLKSHMLKHTDEKPFLCDHCEKSFKQQKLLRRHQNLYHNPNYKPKPPKEKTYTCHECSQSYAHKGNLIRHLAIHDQDSVHKEQALALKRKKHKKIKSRCQ